MNIIILLLSLLSLACQKDSEPKEVWGIPEPMIERQSSKDQINFMNLEKAESKRIHLNDRLLFATESSVQLSYKTICGLHESSGIKPIMGQIQFIEFVPRALLLNPPFETTQCSFKFRAALNGSTHDFELNEVEVIFAVPQMITSFYSAPEFLPRSQSGTEYARVALQNPSNIARKIKIDPSLIGISLDIIPRGEPAQYLEQKLDAKVLVYNSVNEILQPDSGGFYDCPSLCELQVAILSQKNSSCAVMALGIYARIVLGLGSIEEFDSQSLERLGQSIPFELPEFYLFQNIIGIDGQHKSGIKYERQLMVTNHFCVNH